MRLDILYGVTNGLDLFCILVRDLEIESFLQRHNQLDDIKGVSAEIIDERSLHDDVFFVHTKLFHDNFLNLFKTHNIHPLSLFMLQDRKCGHRILWNMVLHMQATVKLDNLSGNV